MPRSEKVRIYKRDEMGKRVLIDDFSLDEIGSMPLAIFVKDYLHEEYGNEQSATKYEFYELDRNGREKAPPGEVNLAPVAGGHNQQQNDDPLHGVRRAMDVVGELQHFMQPGQKNPMLEAAQQRALGSGDFNGMMMMMMMEKLMSGSGGQNEILLKVLDRIDRLEGGKRGTQAPDFGPGPGFFPPPMPFGGPFGPPPPVREERHSSSDKLLDMALAKMANPPTLADSIKELMALQNLMQPQRNDSSEVQALRAELRQALATAPKGGIEDSLANFEKLTTIVKSVAPQINGNDSSGSGVAGFLKGIFSNPEVGKAIGGIISGAQSQASQQAVQAQPVQQVAPQHMAQQHMAQPQPQQLQQPAPRDPNLPPQPPPQAVLDAVRIFRFAQTPEVQAQRFVDVALAMYTSEDPYYLAVLNPALADLNKADQHIDYLRTPRKVTMSILANLRSSLATPDFTDACLAALAQKVGAELPQTLISTRGKWSLENGEVKMLEEVGAKPVPAADVLKDTQAEISAQAAQAAQAAPVEASASPSADLVPSRATA